MRNGTVEGLTANGGVNHRCVTVELLTGETILISTEGKTTCSAIWNRVEGELVARGVVHPQIFGLAIKTGSDWVFVDPDAKVSKYFPKEWKSTSQNNPGSISDNKTLVLFCRVHFYLDALPQSLDVVSLHHYYLQLRQNLVSTPRHPAENITQPIAFAYQAELSDWRPCQETPIWAQHLNLGPALTRAHQALATLSQQDARLAFIRAVMPNYNMHLYAMTLRTKDGKDAPVWIGVTPKGIEVYQNAVGCVEIPEHPKVTFLWANITKLYFERKKFEIRGRACPWAGSTQKLSFTAASESVPRHLLILCRSTHQFHLSNHKMLLTAELSHNNKGSSSLSSTGGESSCNSTLLGSSSSTTSKNDEKMLDLSLWADGLLLANGGESNEHQRVSVISNASSNTTSGIVSDRVYSLDGSEEDLDLREMSYCCPERHTTDNSTSLESLSQKHPPPPRPHKNSNSASKSHVSCNGSASNLTGGVEDPASSPHCANGNASSTEESEAKYWYCDSDCEDCDDAGPCRSSLVRTIGEKRACTDHCQCNSCATGDELDGLDLATPSRIIHHNTPSMVSEGTLKAVDICCENDNNDRENESSQVSGVRSSSGNNTRVQINSKVTEPCQTNNTVLNDTLDNTMLDKLVDKVSKVENVNKCDPIIADNKETVSLEKRQNNNSDSNLHEQLRRDLCPIGLKREEDEDDDDPMEHVYGEICEDEPDGKTDPQYFTIDSLSNKNKASLTETNGEADVRNQKPASRNHGCVKSAETKLRCKSKLLKEFKSRRTTSSAATVSPGSCTNGNGKCENEFTCGSSYKKNFSTNPTLSTNVLATKENGLTPKIASLKCLKTQKGPSSSLSSSSCTSWLPGGKMVGKKNALNSKKNDHNSHMSQQQNDYVEFGEKLQQGRYPSTRTVSDNFDTDSDYVQLPPLFPRPLPKKPASKLWKFVTKTSSSKINSLGGSSSNLSPFSSSSTSTTPSPTPAPSVNLNTLPRRHKLEHSLSISNNEPKFSNITKVPSKSTTALNNILGYGNDRPNPPPKPIKRHVSTNSTSKSQAVDARFIATKPQILVQTAYATAAPVGIPSQAQVLFRTSKVPSTNTGNGNSSQNVCNYHSLLQHSQSVDNIYDTVACEEPVVNLRTSIPSLTPPSYPYKTPNHGGKTNSVIIKPNNYIDVHASVVKNRKSTMSASVVSPPQVIAQVNSGGTAATSSSGSGGFNANGGKCIANRCGSVPNNLNNFLIGLQNLKPLSRAPIVHPAATSSMSINSSNVGNNNNNVQHHMHAGNLHTTSHNGPNNLVASQSLSNVNYLGPGLSSSTTSVNYNNGNCQNANANGHSRYTTVYTSQLSRSQIQQFKAQLYSDMDYVIFPPKDPRVSQQEYYDSKSLSYTTLSSSNSAAAYGMNDIPPPYLPPPPPYPAVTGNATTSTNNLTQANNSGSHGAKPPRPAKTIGIGSTTVTSDSNHSIAGAYSATSPSSYHNSYGSIYNIGSNNSQCSSSQYAGGYYAAVGSLNLNAENIQRFLSAQSLASSNISSAPIYYPCSTQSAPPLPPYNNKYGPNAGQNIIIENEMRKTVQSQLMSRVGPGAGSTLNEERLRMKLCRSEESLCRQTPVLKQTEEKLQAMYNLPPPPPYNGTKISPSDLDLASLRAKCQALELPLLRALCSDGALLTQTKPRTKIRPTAHAHPHIPHPKLAPKQLSLPPKPLPPVPSNPNSNLKPPPLPQKPKAS